MLCKKWTYHKVWYILNKWQTHKWVGCISLLRTVAVHLLLFLRLSCKANCSAFLYGLAVPVKKMQSVICCCKYYRANVLRIALGINLIFLFNWFSLPLVLFTPVLSLCRLLSYVSLNRPRKHCSSLPVQAVQAKNSTLKLPTVCLLA